jgi:hypothetical protein
MFATVAVRSHSQHLLNEEILQIECLTAHETSQTGGKGAERIYIRVRQAQLAPEVLIAPARLFNLSWSEIMQTQPPRANVVKIS